MTEPFVEIVEEPVEEVMPGPERLRPKRVAVAVRVACMLIRDEWLRAQQWAAWMARA